MRVLVIGGTRFIGPFVVTRLCDLGHEVLVFHRGQTGAGLPQRVEHLLGERQHLAGFGAAFKRFAPQVVLDMIPMGEQDARTVMDTLRGLARRVVAVSSQDVYRAYGRLTGHESGAVDPVPLAEDAPLRHKLYPYRGESPRERDDPQRWLDDYDKILVERVVLADPHLPGTVLRLPMVYGPGDRQHRLFEYLKRMDDGRPAILLDEGLAKWRWTRGYVENVAAAIALAVVDARASGRIYNVGESEALTTVGWVREIGRVAGWLGKVVIVPAYRLPAHLAPNVNTDQHLVADTTCIRRELGYDESVPRDEALRRALAWERAHPPAQVESEKFDYAAEDAALGLVGLGSDVLD
jgi:nucleoside-diphosphate-sugar epimerase